MLKLKGLLFILLLSALAGCSNLPKNTQLNDGESNITYQHVLQYPHASMGHLAQWQGQIAAVHNMDKMSQIEIVYQKLDYQGKVIDDQSPGRFVANIPKYIEPMIYKAGRTITVKGHIAAMRSIMVDKMEQRVPTLNVEHFYLWPPVKPEPRVIHSPFFAHSCLFWDE